MRRSAGVVATLAVAWMCAGCGAASPEASAPPTPSAVVHVVASAVDEGLRSELLAMLERDQAGRLGGVDEEGDQRRTARLDEIIAEHGWPGVSLVGEDGEDAAWAIAQHSDLDPDFQERALDLLSAAVAADDASPGNLAYLSDRIAAAKGEPQRYGTQVACGEDGPTPATPLEDEASVDDLRADAGLPPFEDYLAEMAQICAEVE